MNRRSFLLAASAVALAPAFPAQATPQRELIEIFNFTCSPCHRLDARLGDWAAMRGVSLQRLHVIVSDADFLMAAAYYAAMVLGKGDAFRTRLFEAIQTQNRAPNERMMVEIAGSLGIESSVLVGTMRGEQVASWLGVSEAWTKRLPMPVTPAFVLDRERVMVAMTEDPLEMLDAALAG